MPRCSLCNFILSDPEKYFYHLIHSHFSELKIDPESHQVLVIFVCLYYIFQLFFSIESANLPIFLLQVLPMFMWKQSYSNVYPIYDNKVSFCYVDLFNFDIHYFIFFIALYSFDYFGVNYRLLLN